MGCNKIKVLFPVSAVDIGGGENYVIEILKNIDREKFHVSVAAPIRSLFYKLAKPYSDKIYNIPFWDNADIYSFFRLMFLIKKYDVIHANLNRACFFSSLISKIFKNKNILCTMHGIDKFFYYKYSPLTIFLSEFQRDYFKKMFSNKKTSVVKIGVNVDKFNKINVLPYRKKINISQKCVLIGVLARLHNLKGHFTMIRVAQRLKDDKLDFKIVFIGDGPDRKKIEQEIKLKNLEEYFILEGNVEHPETIIKNNFDIMILPSKKENIPLSILENMCCEVPVLASSVGGIPEELDPDFIIDDIENEDVYADKILFLINNKEKIKQNIKRNKEFVENNFNIKDMTDKLEKIYEKRMDIYR